MIKSRTVFVLGAGANVPYGFSTGGGLIDILRGKDPQTVMGNAGNQITKLESAKFLDAVIDNMLPSIDAMLEHRTDLVKVGKRVMATILYTQEAAAGPRSFLEDWMSLIFSRMADEAATLEEFAQNAVSFVTFNYDRYLEHRFIRGLVARYNVSASNAWVPISSMFIHLYGSLGDLPEQLSGGSNAGRIVPFGAPEPEDTYHLGLALSVAENLLTIVHDAAQPPATFNEALKRFQTAQQILFLGFGFGKKNIERLGTAAIPKSTNVDCTTYGMTPEEVLDSVVPAFPNHELSNLRRAGSTADKSICLFLRERIRWLK
jgi:hypothetical protein